MSRKKIRLLFISMVWPMSGTNNMYSELISEFTDRGHEIDVVALSEKRNNIYTHIEENGNLSVAFSRCGNIQKMNKYKKVLNSFFANLNIISVSHKYYKNRKYDAVLFALPPLTVAPAIVYLKRMYKTKLYLLLKEFWPQDPVDLGAMKYGGIVWFVFRHLEKMLYKNSDYIGTMSEAGSKFLKEHNPELKAHVEVCPNSQKVVFLDFDNKKNIKEKYGLPLDKCIFVFGGNFGVSQGIPEMIAEIKAVKDITDAFFLLIGNGTEFNLIENELSTLETVKILPYLAREEFDKILCACDVGLIFLYPQYSVPNIPSRMISYLLAKLPILAAVDCSTDAGDIVEKAGCGIKVLNGNEEKFKDAIIQLLDPNLRCVMSKCSEKLMLKEYSTKRCYQTIINHF